MCSQGQKELDASEPKSSLASVLQQHDFSSLMTNESPHYEDSVFKQWNIAPCPPLLGVKQKTLHCLQQQTLSGATTVITHVIHGSCTPYPCSFQRVLVQEEELKTNFNMSFTLLITHMKDYKLFYHIVFVSLNF